MRIRRILPVVLAVLAALPVASAAGAPRFDQAFDLPNVQTNGQLTRGPDGNLWVSLDGAVGRVTPAGGVTEYTSTDLPNVLAFPTGAITSAAGFIWVGQSGGNDPLVKIPPGNPAGATGVPVAGLGSLGSAMTTGPDGNIWFAVNDKIVKFAPSNPAGATTYDAPGLVPRGIATATDGTLCARQAEADETAPQRGFPEADDGPRTRDLRLGKPTLYQLSYVRVPRGF